MPAFVPVPNGLQVELVCTDQNADIQENSIWIKRSAPWTLSLIDAMCAAIASWFTTGDGTHSYQGQMCNFSELSALAARDHTTISSFSTVYQAGLPIVGSNATAAQAAGLTKSFTFRTGLAGKSYRGRSFFIGLAASHILALDNNTLQTAFLTDMVDAWTSLIAAVTAADAEAVWAVCSRYYQPGGPSTPTVPRASGVTTPVLAVGYSNNLIDFQRRRAPGHSRHH